MSAPHDDGRGYREAIAEMRGELVDNLRKELPRRCSGMVRARYRDTAASCHQCARLARLIRRIRALDAVVELAAVGEQARHDLALDLQETVRAAQERVPIESACAGLTAVWCPVHGDCECPRNAAGERSLDGLDCPLHSYSSQHAMPEPQP